MVTVLKTVNTAIKDLGKSVTARLAERPDGEIFTSLPGSGRINAAQILTGWGDRRASYPASYSGPDPVAVLAGMCPVTKASGRHRPVGFRWARDKRFRKAMTSFADHSRRSSPWAEKIYTGARAGGKDHAHAIRVLARAWIRVIWRCRLDGIPCDPAEHGATAPLTAPEAA